MRIFQVTFFVLCSVNVAASANLNEICSSDDECTSPNQLCKIDKNFDPPCQKGFCACKPCHKNVKGECKLIKFLGELMGSCAGGVEEDVIVDNAFCNQKSSSLDCLPGYKLSDDGKCVLVETCSETQPCPETMVCLSSSTCQCKSSEHRVDTQTGRCISHEFGNTCTNSSNCNGELPTTWVEGYAVTYGECLDGSCQCSSDSQSVFIGYIDLFTSSFKNKTICLNKNATVQSSPGAYCHVSPLLTDDSTNATCDGNHFCLSCPEENHEHNIGRCRKPKSYDISMKLECPNKPKVTVRSAVSGNEAEPENVASTEKPGYVLIVMLITSFLFF